MERNPEAPWIGPISYPARVAIHPVCVRAQDRGSYSPQELGSAPRPLPSSNVREHRAAPTSAEERQGRHSDRTVSDFVRARAGLWKWCGEPGHAAGVGT